MTDGYYDRRPQTPLVVLLLAGAIVATFLLTGQYDPERHQDIFNLLAIVPARFDASSPDHYQSWADAAFPLFGHVFAHYGWPHILMNMLAYLQASPFLARRIGGARFLLLFFLSALGGAGAFILINAHANYPAVGASGAICGLFGAYFLAVRPTPTAALADPQVRNAILSFLGINVVLMGFLAAAHILPIAWEAHLGGFIVGGLAYLVLAPKNTAVRGPWG
ncbi:MAG: rhomboid family intramembrane serine protease [Proteobacteria bacterium]|nr:rhomboid family intramembrane serine protease [Pseudomonadota bacterium]